MSSARKRVVSSCKPCYNRKQKCNREYPCNHCARRQCPEQCSYYPDAPSQASSPMARIEPRREETCNDKERRVSNQSLSIQNDSVAITNHPVATISLSDASFVETFGYFEGSEANMLALMRKMGLGSSGNYPSALSPDALAEVNRSIVKMPDRQILDFLVKYFIAEINWMHQLIHVSWFLEKYQRWWKTERVLLLKDVDFVVLILRICSYATQFLPSPSYILDKIRGVQLIDIRNTCDAIADRLAAVSKDTDRRGSLIRMQHMSFFALKCQIEEKSIAFWEALSDTIRVAQSICAGNGTTWSRKAVDETEREMERRIFCNLYVWDHFHSHQLDRVNLIQGCLSPGDWPQIQIENLSDGAESHVNAPDPFSERFFQARLADFWRSLGPWDRDEYDMLVAEERYDKFCREYLAILHPAFALQTQANEAWDKRVEKLPLQRQLLHIAIYESLCLNFRPLLLNRPPDQSLPIYKRVLLGLQKNAMALAALRILDSARQLHAMLGGSHTRFAGLVFSTFEAAMQLLCLCNDPLFPADCPLPCSGNIRTDPLRVGLDKITRQGCFQAVQGALDRLRMLAEVSKMADVGANTLEQLMIKVSENSTEMHEVVQGQIQEAEQTSTTISQTSFHSQAASASGEVPGWPSWADLSMNNDLMAMSATPAGNSELTNWSNLDIPMNNDLQNDFSSMNTSSQGWERHGI